MARCNPSTPAVKACSGKCMSGPCGKAPRVWVVAACEGMISLFEKQAGGAVCSIATIQSGVFPSLEDFLATMKHADTCRMVDKVIIVGGRTDIAWIHSALPEAVATHVAAEIEYPLVANWFRESGQLSKALERVFAG